MDDRHGGPLGPRRMDPGAVDGEVDDELRFHLEATEEELIRAGWDPGKAAAEARRRFGDLESVRNRSRTLRRQAARRNARAGVLAALVQDFRLEWRGLVRDRAVSIPALVTLALGTGFATALFGLVDSVLLRPLPYPDAGGVVYLWQNDRATGTVREPAGTADFYDFRQRTRSFSATAMFLPGAASLTLPGGETRPLRTAAVHHDLPGVLGITPVAGRWIRDAETEGEGPDVVLLGEELWRRAFGGDPALVGRTVLLDDAPHEVVGILPRGASLVMGGPVEAWTPLRMTPARATRSPHQVTVVARLAPGVTQAAAASEMTGLAAAMEEEDPENRNRGVLVESVGEYLRGPATATLAALQGAVALLLVLMTLNVAHLLMGRSLARGREAAIHRALGAGSGRVARRAVLGTLLLAMAGTAAGLLVAIPTLDLLAFLVPPGMRGAVEPRLDLRVALFGLLLAPLLALAAGLPPALSGLRADLRSALSSHGAGSGAPGAPGAGGLGRIRPFLVSIQAAVAAALVVGATLLGSTVANLYRVDPGFMVAGTARLTLALPAGRYPADFATFPAWPERLGLQDELLRRTAALPGVEAVALAVNHPLDPGFTNSFRIEGRDPVPGQGEMTTRMVTPGYFPLVGLRVLEGRHFDERDGPLEPGVVVINREAARRFFPEGGAVGGRIAFWGQTYREIVGIVEDERVHGVRSLPPPAFYVNLLQTPTAAGELTLLARGAGDPMALAGPLQRAVSEVDPALGILEVTTLEATLARSLERERFTGGAMAAFAGMALGLAGLGVYGVLGYSVERRRREMGLRLALGARGDTLRREVVRQGLVWVAPGILAGLVLARLGSRVLDTLLYGVEAGSPWVYLIAGAVLLSAATVAALVPAGRAARIDPALSLRGD